MSKDEIRNKLFKKGSALLPSYKKLENLKIQKNFLKTFELRKSKNILLYRNIKNEIPTNLIMLEAIKLNIDIYFPVVAEKNKLIFTKYLENSLFKKNKYGIEEPVSSEIIDPMNLSIVVIPFIGIDKNGFRLGYGGGYYDRVFGSLAGKSNFKIVGLGFDYQLIEYNFKEEHDLKYDVVVTEKQNYFF